MFALYDLPRIETMAPPPFLVDELLFTESLGVVSGKPAVGKSFVALDLALHVAHARTWAGRRVAGGPVLYIAAEGAAHTGRRIRAWSNHIQCDPLAPFRLLPAAINLRSYSESSKLIDTIKAEAHAVGSRFSLVVIDTVARCFGDGDENSAQDMGAFISSIDRVRQETSATILAVHHFGKDEKGERGSSALPAAVDTALHIKKVGDLVTIAVAKQKDAEPCAPIKLRLMPIRFKDDALGSGIASSCVMVSDGSGSAHTLDLFQAETLAR